MSALTNAIDILRCFSTTRPDLSFADVQGLTGKPKSSTSRLLRSLRDCGLLEQDPHTRRYRPGLLTFELGRLHRAHDDLLAIAERELRDVCARTGHTGYIAVLDGYQQVVLRIVPGSNPLRVVNPPGQRTPAIVTSNGRAMLARLSDQEIRARVPLDYPKVPANSPQNFNELMARLNEIRRTGISDAADEAIEGVGSQGFALSSGESGELIGIAVSYSVQATTEIERANVRRELNAMATKLRRMTGDPLGQTIEQLAGLAS
ncbi:putative transcriptional regulatory protein, IclR family [Bradyrhizobium sp. ORS 285]|uniref:IclR family transcriptional regulator n=1 Tax=Bradyrhizobium sp. ORS 285 TaxID=115808 RepID=UPI0002409F82|nr:IclR family transcriptional regulator [Bradyrhizobium sp. ORS 285]CCD84055.1 putative transcriptional regulatory protein, IclR family [Bradyrhizobium sp. ORS 285]SMX59969.1 putative transcriptional regulatory protein, IclR family [Bradyrhizobium sp. ORS 285]